MWRTLQRAAAGFSRQREILRSTHLALRNMTRRRLPHIYPKGAWLFVTWHLHGSLPRALYPPPGKPSAGKAFVWMDRYLDTTRLGPAFLRRPEVGDVVVATLHRGLGMGLYVSRPQQPVSRLLQWLKGTTARDCNRMLARTGTPFWQRESYDHWVRNERELERIASYIENNPVKAGLTVERSHYRWSSAWASPNGSWRTLQPAVLREAIPCICPSLSASNPAATCRGRALPGLRPT